MSEETKETKPVQVVYSYDEQIGRWDVKVLNAKTAHEARQAFCAVALTSLSVDIEAEHMVTQDEEHYKCYKIKPVVFGEPVNVKFYRN